MSRLAIASIIACMLLFLWTAANVIIATSLWFQHRLVPSDRKILVYLLVCWLFTIGVLLLAAAAVQEAGLLKEWWS